MGVFNFGVFCLHIPIHPAVSISNWNFVLFWKVVWVKKYPISRNFPHFERRVACFLLALSWFLGLCCGIQLSLSAGNHIVSMMHSFLRSPVSIVSLLSATIFPLFLSAFAVFSYRPSLIFFAGFLKAVLHSYCSMLLYRAFSDSGWLVRYLFLFHSYCSACMLLLFLMLGLCRRKHYLGCTFGFLLAMDVLAASAEYCIFTSALADCF